MLVQKTVDESSKKCDKAPDEHLGLLTISGNEVREARDPNVSLEFDEDEKEAEEARVEVDASAAMPVLEDGLSDTETEERAEASSDFVYAKKASEAGAASVTRAVSSYSPSSSSISNSPPPPPLSGLRVGKVGEEAIAKQQKDSMSEREYDTDEETNRLLAAENRSNGSCCSGSAHVATDVAAARKADVASKRHQKSARPRESNTCFEIYLFYGFFALGFFKLSNFWSIKQLMGDFIGLSSRK